MAFLIAILPVLAVQVADHLCSHAPAVSPSAQVQSQASGACHRYLWIACSAAASVLGLAVLFAIGNRLARPIRRLARGAGALAVGDYRRRLAIRTGDELEMLGASFNSLGESLADYERRAADQAGMLTGLAESVRGASSSLDLRQCQSAIVEAVCTHLGAVGAALFVKNTIDGGIGAVAHFGQGPDKVWGHLAAHSAGSGGYLVIAERHGRQTQLSLEGDSMLVGIPLQAGSSCLGAIAARFIGTNRDDLRMGSYKADVLNAFGVHAAAALANAQAYSRTEVYSEVLEDWVEHLSAVMRVTDSISPHLTLDQTLQALSAATRSALKTDHSTILLPDQQGRLVNRSVCSDVMDDSFAWKTRLRPEDIEAGTAFLERRYVVCEDMHKSPKPGTRQIASELGLSSLLCAPLLVRDEAIGVITVASKQPRSFTPAEVRLLTSIGQHAAVVVRNASLYTREASIASALQSGLMSDAPERDSGLCFAGAYMPARGDERIGGDFYDVVPLADGKVGVVIADVSGKGLDAAIHLARSKFTMQAVISAYPGSPAKVLHELNYVVNQHSDFDFFVTVFYAIIDADAHTLDYANAGHPPALLISRQGRAHTSLTPTGIPVGTGYRCDYQSRRVSFEPSDVLLLYTDGVIDSTIAGRQVDMEGLHKLVFDADVHTARELVDHLIALLCADKRSSQRDDIALLAISYDEALIKPTATGGQCGQESSLATHNA